MAPATTEDILVGFHAGTSESAGASAYTALGGTKVEYLSALRVHRVRVPIGQGASFITRLLAQPAVRFAELDTTHQETLTPNDPSLASQYMHTLIGSATAWNNNTGTGMVIAILDSGIDSDHPDLVANLVAGFNAVTGGSTEDISDIGHGTKVAGVAAARGNNAIGIAGVAYTASLMPIVVSDHTGYAKASAIAAGLIWAADHGAKIANISINGCAGSATILAAAQYARSLGCMVVAAAGNCSCLDPTPANPYIISVASVDSAGVIAPSSSRGVYVDIAAPGVAILTTAPGGGDAISSGTSFAAPVVAGVLALMRIAKTTLTLDQYEALLKSSATAAGATGYDTVYGFGIVSSLAAVAAAAGGAPVADVTAPTCAILAPLAGAKVSGVLEVLAAANDAVGVTSVELWVDGAKVQTDTLAPWGFALDTRDLADGSHTLQVRAKDAAANTGTSPLTTITTYNDIVAPSVAVVSAVPTANNLAVVVTATATVVVSKVEIYLDGLLRRTLTRSPYTVTIGIGSLRTGSTHQVTARAYAPNGTVTASASTSFTK